jgi:hypothetical protein
MGWFNKDWLNPDTWKPAADLVSVWKALGALASALWRWGGRLWQWLVFKLRRAKPAAPTVAPQAERPLRFVVDDHRTTYGPVGADEETGTHVHGVWDVTNVSNSNFVLLKVRLGDHGPFMPGVVGVQCANGAYQVKDALPAHRISTAMIELAFKPAIHSASEDLISDVIFTDNYGDEHRLPSVRFRRRGPLTAPLSTVTA